MPANLYDTKYNVIGCSDDSEEAILLHESATQHEAMEWVTEYTRWGNFGGYDEIRIVRLSHNDVMYSVREDGNV